MLAIVIETIFGAKWHLTADLALIDANVRTMNPRQPIAQAVAIKKNRIIKVGTDREIKKLIGKDTKVISLNGKTVVPGLIDTHIHVADFGRCLMWLDLSGAQSVKDLQNILTEKAKQTPAGKWIIGRGWNENCFKEKRLLTLIDLDAVAPDNPVILYHGAAYACAVNSKALAQAGVTNETLVPSGGTIDKNYNWRIDWDFSGQRHQPCLASSRRTIIGGACRSNGNSMSKSRGIRNNKHQLDNPTRKRTYPNPGTSRARKTAN